MTRVSEVARERETYKFTSRLFENARAHPTAAATPAAEHLPDKQLLTSTCHDTALTAFAQLGTYRLGAARCLISVFDRTNQYVVTEATLNSAIGPVQGQRDDLWLGGTAIPRHLGVCEHILTADNESTTLPRGQLPISIVSDLACDTRFSNRSYIQNSPYNRFYAGIPIRSPGGINIGVLGVFDNKPRDGLDSIQLQFLRDISRTITKHWECNASTVNYRKSERMIRGLGSFVEGKTTISGWRHKVNTSSFINTGDEGDLNENQQILEDERKDLIGEQFLDYHPQRPAPTPVQGRLTFDDSNSTINQEKVLRNHEQTTDATSTSVSTNTHISAVRTTATLPTEEPLVKAIQGVFSRAANIIREAIEIEGVLFLDASVGSFGGLVPGPDTDSGSSSGPSNSIVDGIDVNEEDSEGICCNILGYSTSDVSSIDTQTSSRPPEATFPEKFLRSLLRRYPGGRAFLFDEDGAMQSTDDEAGYSEEDTISPNISVGQTTEKSPAFPMSRPNNPSSRRNEAKSLISLFPEARCIALVPLWDSRKERWFAGSFLWTKVPVRSFTVNGELSYLRAFGATIMSEITRLTSSLAEKATNDLLGSLSHELRSPLHGVIAAVELLQDTDIDAFQGNLIHTMESCGRTLLDSIDHMLDYTKINRLIKNQRQTNNPRAASSGRLKSFESQMKNVSSTIELATLAEETVESIFAGHNFHKMSIAQFIKNEKQQHRDVDSLRKLDSVQAFEALSIDENLDLQALQPYKSSVSVYLHIDPHVPWLMHATPGAVRRIIMNLLGNALKFTKNGFVVVTLKQEPSASKGRKGQFDLNLNVSDSGKGIASEFLHDRAFKPFSQEDSLSPGAGLGLSIVHQISKALGGSARIESQLHRGTSVTVTIPLQIPQPHVKPNPQSFEHISALKGLRVVLRGLNTEAQFPGISTQSPPTEASLMEIICRDWLHLEIISPERDDIRPDVIICTDTYLTRTGPVNPTKVQPPMVAICCNALAAYSLSEKYGNSYGKGIFEFISQPTGPRKLASAVVLALGKYNDSKGSELIAIRSSVSSESTSDFSSMPSSTTPTPLTELMTPILDQAGLEEPSKVASRVTEESVPVGTVSIVPASEAGANIAIEIAGQEPITISHALYEAPEIKNKGGTRCLLVDDNNINIQILALFMKKLKYSYKTATNGLKALEAYAAAPDKYSYILMDISMPIMDGLESTRRIRELEHTRKLKPVTIIALTGLASASAQQDAFASGIDMYMTKPVRFKELAKVLGNEDNAKPRPTYTRSSANDNVSNSQQ